MHEHTVQVYCYGTFRLEVTLYTMGTSQVFMCKQGMLFKGGMVIGTIDAVENQEIFKNIALTDC